MSLFIISFLLFEIILAAMSVGVIFSGRTIRGSCGGLNDLQGGEDGPVGSCEICGWTGDPVTGPGDLCRDRKLDDELAAGGS